MLGQLFNYTSYICANKYEFVGIHLYWISCLSNGILTKTVHKTLPGRGEGDWGSGGEKVQRGGMKMMKMNYPFCVT